MGNVAGRGIKAECSKEYFDVQLISLPASIYAQVEPWDYDEQRMYRMVKYAQEMSTIIKNKD